MGKSWKRTRVPWLFLIVQNLGVAARKRGVKKPRGMLPKTRLLEADANNIFWLAKGGKGGKRTTKGGMGGKTTTRSSGGRGKKNKSRFGGKGKGGKNTSWDPSSAGTSPTLMPVASEALDIPSRNSKLCKSDGVFGSERGDNSLVVFIYQVELDPGTTANQFENTILPQFENEVLNLMIPYFFDSLCGLFRRLEEVPSGYVGISAMPNDHILSEGGCF